MWLFAFARIHFDVIVRRLLCVDESVRFCTRVMMCGWIQIKDRQDVLAAALRLQRDAGLMASNLQVLGQYVMASELSFVVAPTCQSNVRATKTFKVVIR